jgi:hypothetical protein
MGEGTGRDGLRLETRWIHVTILPPSHQASLSFLSSEGPDPATVPSPSGSDLLYLRTGTSPTDRPSLLPFLGGMESSCSGDAEP